jgi:hypothetical protein
METQWWCMKCGAPATYLMASMDDRYGIGFCQAGMKNHDRILVTPRRDEIELLLARIAVTKRAVARERKQVHGYTLAEVRLGHDQIT